MKFQNKQPRGNRVPRNRNQESRGDNRPRKGSNQPNDNADKPFKKRFIKRDQPRNQKDRKGKSGKGPRKEKRNPENRDLDRELRNYWVTQKGGEGNEDAKEFARQKLDSQMDNYWKQKKEEEPAKSA